MEIRVFATNPDLPDHLRWQIISVVRMEWHATAGDYTGPSALPEEWHPAHVVGTEGDAIVSYAGVVWRDIQHAGRTFRTYGLSSVFTFPALRRRGFGTEVVRCATARIRQAGDADFALLFTRPGMEAFYQRGGWQAMPSTEFLVGSRTAPTRHGDVPMMLFVSAKGQRHRSLFDHASVYFGEDPW
jgi:aminoglycoside 2'-N-acetyltransferase I